MKRRIMSIGVLLVASLVAAACGSSSGSGSASGGGSSSGGSGGVLTIDNESGALWTCNFNPYNLSDIGLSFGTVYEPLVFVNSLQSAKTTPWLASSFAYSHGNKTLTFTIRKGVKWSDGKPMTAADVAFSFNLLKKFKALDINAVWSVLSSVTQKGDTVVMNFKAPAVNYFYYIADQVAIVPQHIWSSIANPVKYPDTKPVGTGAFTMSACTRAEHHLQGQPDYYMPGAPKLEPINYPAFTCNDPANTYLANGQAQWGSQFIPSIQKFYLDKSSDNHYWFPPVANVSLFINLKNPILSDLAVRQAMAYAIDRNKVSQIGEYGYEPAANQTGIVTPDLHQLAGHTPAAKYGNNYAYNPAKAKPILKRPATPRAPTASCQTAGKKLSFSIINIGGYSDWVASVSVIQQRAEGRGHPGSRRRTCRAPPTTPTCTTASTSSATAARPAARRRTTSCASGCTSAEHGGDRPAGRARTSSATPARRPTS